MSWFRSLFGNEPSDTVLPMSNPASAAPMVNDALDVLGNVYGTNNAQFTICEPEFGGLGSDCGGCDFDSGFD